MDEQEIDNQFDDIDGGNDAAPESGSQSGSAPSVTDQSGEESNSQKRINDLMSARDQATARANAAEAELQRLRGGDSAPDRKTKGETKSQPSEGEQWAALLRDQAQELLYRSDPRLAEYGIDKSLITGSTPEEMRASLAAQIKLVEAIETRARNKALVEHGLEPEVRGGSGERAPDYAAMSKEEFEKEVQRALSRR